MHFEVCYDAFFFFINQLLEKKKTQVNDMGEDLECLCQIMRTVGPRLDHKKAKVSPICIRFLIAMTAAGLPSVAQN